jgi:peroxiredoxin/tetratricopeptide (TPR) repeat protein
MFALTFTAISLAFPITFSAAQTPTEKDPKAGHSIHGAEFNEGPRQKARLISGTGKISLPITVRHPEGQAWFHQGVGQLHGFQWWEAERSFRQVLALDPDCPMAMWGLAMANFEQDKRAKPFIEKAKKLADRVSPRERLWIDAIHQYFTSKDQAKDRRRALVRSFERIIHEFPDETEARAFLAWHLWAGKDKGLPITSHQAVDDLIGVVLAREPMHNGAHHYRVHLWDGEKSERALASAALIGPSAPAIAHQWHMAGHTYSSLKRHDDAAYMQEASARIDHAYTHADRVMPTLIHNYSHNNQWLATSLSHQGRAREAIQTAESLIRIPRHPKFNKFSDGGGCARMGRARLFDVLSRYELDERLLAAVAAGLLERSDDAEERLLFDRHVGLAALALGKLAEADARTKSLEKELADAKAQPQNQAGRGGRRGERAMFSRNGQVEEIARPAPGADKPADGAKPAGDKSTAGTKPSDKPEPKTNGSKPTESTPDPAKPGNAAGKDGKPNMAKPADAKAPAKPNPRVERIERILAEFQAQRLSAQGKHAEAWPLWKSIKEVRKTRLARAASLAGDHAEATRLANEAVNEGKNEAEPLAVEVSVLFAAGRKPEARQSFESLRSVGARADLDLPVFARLAPIAKEFGWAADWRTVPPAPNDIGPRPELASFGPLEWSPWQAPSWELPSGSGGNLGSNSFAGRPVIVIGYLGAGCLHCVEQLKKFAPMTEKFRAAGIEVVAFSTDRMDDLRTSAKSWAQDEKSPFPIPLAADPEGAVFRRFRAWDDFGNKPLHLTALIDADGKVRWQDIGADPFTDPAFLLTESKRLLSLSGPGRVPGAVAAGAIGD